ncbi:putative zinc finger protein [Vibrio phage pVa-7]|nr:putative zinc finger protein [Vibrio phage pVa-7]
MKRTRFYKANGNVGSSLLFWAINGCGYTSDLDKAEVYTLEQAQKDVDNGWLRYDDEFPLSADHVEELAQWRVDAQYIRKTYPEFTDPNDEYVSVKRNCWDGNDLAFGTGIDWDYDYSNAASFSCEDIDPYIENGNHNLYFVPRYHADEIARRTFQMKNINRIKMITKAGIVGLRKRKSAKLLVRVVLTALFVAS